MPSTLKRIGALPVQLTVTVAHIGSRFGALGGALVRFAGVDALLFAAVLAALSATDDGVEVFVAFTAGTLVVCAVGCVIAFTVAVMVLDTST